MTAAAIFVIFPICMAYAAFSDLVSMTIQNRVSVILVAGFLATGLLVGLSLPVMGVHVATGLVALLVTFGMFAAGWMGGGDAKLIAATAVWFGPTDVMFEYLLVGSVYGGVLTLGLIVTRAYMTPATGIGFVDHLLERDTGIPYGIALGAAGLTVYSTSPWIDVAMRLI